jgi:hypothetical protein
VKHPEPDRRVSGLLKALELETHAPAFEEAGVRLEHLPSLGASELVALGLTREEDRARLLEAAAALRHLPPPATPHRVGQVALARAEARAPSIHTAVRPRGGEVPASPRTQPAPRGVPWLGLSIAGLLVGAGVLAALWVPDLIDAEVAAPPQERSPEALSAGAVIPPAPGRSPASTTKRARGVAVRRKTAPKSIGADYGAREEARDEGRVSESHSASAERSKPGTGKPKPGTGKPGTGKPKPGIGKPKPRP